MTTKDPRYQKWHDFIVTRDAKILDEIFDDHIIFRSPLFWTPKEGKEITSLIILTVSELLENFTYQRTWIEGQDWVLEFCAEVEGKNLKGVDLIHWNDEGKISEFEVMIRPANALQALGMKMGERLAAVDAF